MAVAQLPPPPEVHKFPQDKYIDAVRWLPPVSALDRHAVIAFFDSDTDSSSVQIHSLDHRNQPKNLSPVATWASPSRISYMRTSHFGHKPLIAASTLGGSLHLLGVSEGIGEVEVVPGMHAGPVSGVDVVDTGVECVTVGEDGRVNLVNFGGSGVNSSRFFDSNGLVSYTAVKWASPSEFATGGHGFGLHWWDRRRPGGPVSQFKNNWTQGRASGIVHSMDIHPSRKHTCLAGGSSGSIFAWDLRWPNQPIILSGAGICEGVNYPVSESEVWEVQFDCYDKSSKRSSISSSSRILPVVMGSEDGILAVIEQGEESVELLAEPCAVNSFDIDKQNPSDIICSLEWESVAILSRQ